MIAVTLGDLGVTELAIIFAALAYVTREVLDATGWSRSSRTLRVENEDLVRRNKELDVEVGRMSVAHDALEVEVKALRVQVADLQQRDQAAVLVAIEKHEAAAGTRHERMIGVLGEIRDAVKAA